VGGRVLELDVEEGSHVERGDPVGRLSASLAELEVEAKEAELSAARADLGVLAEGSRPEELRTAQAELRAAQKVLNVVDQSVERQRGLVQDGAAPRASLDDLITRQAEARGKVDVAEQRLHLLRAGTRQTQLDGMMSRVEASERGLAAARERLSLHTLDAPSEGDIVDVLIDPGEIVSPGAPVVVLADRQHPYVEVFVPQEDIAGVRPGLSASVRVDAFDQPFSATVEHVNRRTEFTPRYLFSESERANLVVRVRLRIEDPDRKLIAGVPARAVLSREATAP